MRQLLIEVDCGEETCGKCERFGKRMGRFWCWRFSAYTPHKKRCPACLEAERKVGTLKGALACTVGLSLKDGG